MDWPKKIQSQRHNSKNVDVLLIPEMTEQQNMFSFLKSPSSAI
jgi:hypothetical protein